MFLSAKAQRQRGLSDDDKGRLPPGCRSMCTLATLGAPATCGTTAERQAEARLQPCDGTAALAGIDEGAAPRGRDVKHVKPVNCLKETK